MYEQKSSSVPDLLGNVKSGIKKTEMGIYCEAYQNGIYVSQIAQALGIGIDAGSGTGI